MQKTKRLKQKSPLLGLFIGALLGITATLSVDVFALKASNTVLPLAQLKQFSEVYTRIKRDYVETVDDKKLITDAISGMLKGLDPHSDFLDESSYKELREGTAGEFGGLGIEVEQENGFIKVIAPIDDTPAKKAGIQSGDLIIRLDNKSIKDIGLNEAVKLMRGKPGEPIDLLISRKGTTSPLKITLVRDIIKVKSVKRRLLENGYGYVRISSFQRKTINNTRDAINALSTESKTPLNGLVLDLRDNPGGLLSGAVGITDLFLTQGNIVYTEGRALDAKMRYDATPDDLLNGAPLVVLINEGSASASEIVAGALQDHKRALILGMKSFGKGSVQTVLPLDEKTGLKLTTARYFTPAKRSIQAEGITPDITVEALEFKTAKSTEEPVPLSEASLSGHLSNPNHANDGKSTAASENSTTRIANSKSLAREDYQLYEALNTLKSMNLVRLMAMKKN